MCDFVKIHNFNVICLQWFIETREGTTIGVRAIAEIRGEG
jgi:hypothetical protein